MNTTQAIARVRRLLDDRDQNPLVSNDDIRESLRVAIEEVWQLVVTSGAGVFTLSADVTSDSNGVVDLTTQSPLTISLVQLLQGTVTMTIPPVRVGDSYAPVQQATNIRVAYVPRVQLPAVDATSIVWATSAVPANTLDQLLCIVAAQDAWITTGEPILKSLQTRREELTASVKEIPNTPNHTVIRGVGNRRLPSSISWTRGATPNTLQLVY